MNRQAVPVSRDLVKIIRDSSKLPKDSTVGLSDHLRAIDDRQSKGVEFYLRVCAMRLEKSD